MELIRITGYQYITEQEADNARIFCNQYYGIPTSPDATTRNWVLYNYANLNTPPFWFIKWNETLTEVFGQPTDFDVIIEPPPTN